MKVINKPLKIVCADIYLRFPEIMKDEYKDLTEFIEDNDIVCEGATDIFKEQKEEIARLNEENKLFKKLYSETLEEKDQLSNIIDELERDIKMSIKRMSLKQSDSSLIIKSSLEIILDRLKELKEEGK